MDKVATLSPPSHRQNELTAFNMERTITILGTIDNYKKAESLISAKLRSSYDNDMAEFSVSFVYSKFLIELCMLHVFPIEQLLQISSI